MKYDAENIYLMQFFGVVDNNLLKPIMLQIQYFQPYDLIINLRTINNQ